MKQLLSLFLLGALFSAAQSQVLKIDDVDPESITIKGFTITSDQTVNVQGTGGAFKDNNRPLLYYGWILDSKTRKVKWHLFDELNRRDFERRNGMYDFNVDLQLPAGDYELYFTGAYSSRGWSDNWSINDFGDLIEEIFSSRDRDQYRWGMQDQLKIEVSGNLKEVSPDELMDRKLTDAAIYYIKARDDEHFEDGFTITGETSLHIYALGEGRKDEIFDYMWIYEAGTRKRVFEMDFRHSSFGGGADKNMKFDEKITLPAGSYVVNYVTDGSHSFERWNELPPDDPQFWGVTIFPATEADKANFAPYNPPKSVDPMISITRVRDNELRSAGFTLDADMEVRVLCLGEGNYSDEMADYGWIVDATTRETVWKMRSYRSEHAGGATKNRRSEVIIPLKAGDYIAYYVTDGSHSYRDWNAARPLEEELWGLSIWATNEADLGHFKTFDPKAFKSTKVITEIVQVRDDEYYKAYFTLDQPTQVTIIALGEGQEGRMFDYGWIKSMETGQIVWEMEYRNTNHAGGARKNRVASSTLSLPAGEYRVYYETDGSHSFNHWNADPPADPQSYGIRVLKAD